MVFARLVVRLRFVLIGLWLAAAAVAVLLPSGPRPGGGGLDGFVSSDNPTIATEIRSFEIFGFPLLSRVTIVQRDPDGLPVEAQAKAVLRAVSANQGTDDLPLVLGALPIPNTSGVFPQAAESGTTVLTSLFLSPRTSFADQRAAAQEYAERYLSGRDDGLVGVSGSIPARAAQAELIQNALPLVELATVTAIGLLVALAFRSPAAAAVALAIAGLAATVTIRAVAELAAALGLVVPDDVRPLLVALLLGVVTDYVIFFLSGLRQELRSGLPSREAVIVATARTAPIVLAAGLTVGVGTGALLVAHSPLFRGLGPGLALTVLFALLVAVTLVPAVLAVLGRGALWPSAFPRATTTRQSTPKASAFVQVLTRRRTAAAVAAAGTAGLVLAALPLQHLHLGVSFIESLPADSQIAVAAKNARAGFGPGILAPTEVLLQGNGVTQQRPELAEFGDLLRRQPGVGSALGPGSLPTPDKYNVFLAQSGAAARFLVILDERPLSAPAIAAVTTLQQRLPNLLDQAGLVGVSASLAGDTVLSASIVRDTTDDLVRISVAALLANLLMLMLFLRAGWTSLLLLLTSVLALAATLGITVFLFQDLLGNTGLTFYVPFAAAVLLVALGSDYNIFAVGSVWEEARRRPLIEALRVAVPESSRAITAAALTLAASFGLLALVPLRPFRELAFALALGILLDAVVVRSLLVPSMLTLLGDRANPAAHRTRGSARRTEANARGWRRSQGAAGITANAVTSRQQA